MLQTTIENIDVKYLSPILIEPGISVYAVVTFALIITLKIALKIALKITLTRPRQGSLPPALKTQFLKLSPMKSPMKSHTEISH